MNVYRAHVPPRLIQMGYLPPAPPPQPRHAKWTCAYCGCLRIGLSCVGCGAPKIAAEVVR